MESIKIVYSRVKDNRKKAFKYKVYFFLIHSFNATNNCLKR